MDFIIAFSNAEAQRRIRRLLESGGCRPAVCCTSGGEAIRAARNIENSIIICGFRLPDMTANELAADLRGRAAVLVVSSAANVDLCEGENLYKLATPAPRAEFFAILDLLGRSKETLRRRPPPRRDGEECRLIEKAKKLLMDVNRMTEAEAHRFLQKQSMDTGLKLTETAQTVIDSFTR
ncbi:MAG: response regulator [Oscillibacter sp.]|nr:response regulator [Oscillibacter sp.]